MESNKFNTFKKLIDELSSIQKKCEMNAQDTYSVFLNYNDRTVYEPYTFAAYPQSRTAQRYLDACEKCITAWSIVRQYKKKMVENEEDCEYLQPAFHNFSRASMCENHMFTVKAPSELVRLLLYQYLQLRPKDILAKYLTIVLLMLDPYKREKDKLSDFKSMKGIIVAAEMFAYETEQLEDSELKKEILKDLYFHLGIKYSVTCQEFRALDSFKKSFDLDKSNYCALFGIAYHYRNREPSEAIKLFEKYIKIAPQCDKQYDDAFYTLSVIHLMHYRNLDEAFRYAELGDKMFAKKLPCLLRYQSASKRIMDAVRNVFTVK